MRIGLIVFCIVTLLSGWIGYAIDLEIGPQSEQETLGMLIWLVLPFFTALIITLKSGDWRQLGWKPVISDNIRWYMLALLAYPAVTLCVVLIGKNLGWTSTQGFSWDIYLSAGVATLIPNFIKNIFEEFVWRGYLTRKLLQSKVSDLTLYLIVGSIWGLWHLPYYLHFLDHSIIAQIWDVDRISFSVVAVLTMMAWTVLFVEIVRITGSIWPAVLLHTIEDSTINHLLIDRHILVEEHVLVVSPISGIIATAAYFAIGLWLRKERRKLESYQKNFEALA